MMTSTTSLTPERFDANQVELSGVITRIWARRGDIFARLDTNNAPESNDERTLHRATLCFPAGLVNGQEVSLLKGDFLHLTGYLEDLPGEETLRDFLFKAGELNLLEEHPALGKLEGRTRRAMTCVVPETTCISAASNVSKNVPANAIRIEGVVAKTWDYDGHRFARLAVYDQYTRTTNQPGKNGRPHRIPHYVTVQFENGQIAGRPVSLKAKDRCRISGLLVDRPYSENLRTFLLDLRQVNVLAELPNSDDLAEIRIRRSSACVLAQAMVQFTR